MQMEKPIIKKAFDVGYKVWSNFEKEDDKILWTVKIVDWLEEHGIFIHIDYDFHNNDNNYKCEMCLFNGMTCHKGYFPSRKEATLAAIDAALEYLTNNKKK